jgi:hypothetical protein
MRKLFLILPGYCVGFGGLLLITYRTLLAMGSESKAITVHVDRFGEAYFDMIALALLWTMVLVGLLAVYLVMREKTADTVGQYGVSPQKMRIQNQIVSDSVQHPLQVSGLTEHMPFLSFSDFSEQQGFTLPQISAHDNVSFTVTVSQDML